MQRVILIILVLNVLVCCEKTEDEDGIPSWLEPRIEELSKPEYGGTVTYRYDWNNIQIYHVMIPIIKPADVSRIIRTVIIGG